MADEKSSKDPARADDAKRDQVLKKMLGTPPKPKKGGSPKAPADGNKKGRAK